MDRYIFHRPTSPRLTLNSADMLNVLNSDGRLDIPLLPPSLREGGEFYPEDLNTFGDEDPLVAPKFEYEKSMRSADLEDEVQQRAVSNSSEAEEEMLPPPVMNFAAYRKSEQRPTSKACSCDDAPLVAPTMNFQKRS